MKEWWKVCMGNSILLYIYIEFLNLSIQIATQQTKLKGGFNNECVAIVWGDYWKSMHPLVAHGKWDTFK